jgi:hypothetical protein
MRAAKYQSIQAVKYWQSFVGDGTTDNMMFPVNPALYRYAAALFAAPKDFSSS